MKVSTAIRSGAALPVARTRTVIPFYLLATGAFVLARAPLLTGVALAVALLVSRGRVEPLAEELAALDPGTVDPANPSTVPEGLTDALAGLVLPEVVAILAVSALASLVLGLVAGAAASAATLNAVYGALRGDDPLRAGVAGVRDWKPFLGVRLLLLAALAVVGGLPLLAAALLAPLGPGGILAGALAGLVGVALSLAVLAAFAFAAPAIVVDRVGAVEAVRRGAGYARREPAAYLLYLLLAGGATVGYGSVAAGLSLVGADSLAGLIPPLLLGPALDGIRTALYAETPLPERDAPAARTRFSRGIRLGIGRLGGFLGRHPLAILASGAVLTGGIAGGYALTSPYGVELPPPENVSGVFGPIGIGAFANIAANNWLVAVGTSYAGLVLGVGTATALLFNGAIIGGLYGVFDGGAFLALVAPHGAIELPAIVVAGGLGFHLALVGWRGLRGRLSAAAVGEELRRAFDVLVGLGLVLVVAAFVEAFLTPRIAARLLGA